LKPKLSGNKLKYNKVKSTKLEESIDINFYADLFIDWSTEVQLTKLQRYIMCIL